MSTIERIEDHPVETPEQIIGRETPAEARQALVTVLQQNPELADLVRRAVVEDEPDRLRPVRTCVKCGVGKLHSVGRQKRPDGRPGLGGLVICDRCGHYGGRR